MTESLQNDDGFTGQIQPDAAGARRAVRR